MKTLLPQIACPKLPGSDAIQASSSRLADEIAQIARHGYLSRKHSVRESHSLAFIDLLPVDVDSGRISHSTTSGSISTASTTVMASCHALFAATVSPGTEAPLTRQLRTIP